MRPALQAPRAVATKVAASTSSAQSGILSGRDIIIVGDVDFHILFGSNPTATTDCMMVPAKTMLPIGNINAGEKFAVILADGTGNVWYGEAL